MTKFWEILGHSDLFWDFDSLSKEEHKMKWISRDLGPLLGPFWVLGDNLIGLGCRPMGFTHV